MSVSILQYLPLFFLFGLGYFLKRINFLQKDHAALFLKLIMYVAVPALIIPSVASLPLSMELVYLPLIAILIQLLAFAIFFLFSRLFSSFLSFSKKTLGVFLISSMIMNLSFALPFFLSIAGKEQMAYYAFFNIGHDILLFTFVYFLACLYSSENGRHYNITDAVKKILLLPPLWALLLGFVLNIGGISLPEFATTTFTFLGNILIPLVLLALGVYFEFHITHPLRVFPAIFGRMALGTALAFFFISLFYLEGAARLVVLLGGISPLGFNTLIFSSLEKLDTEYAAQLVSFALLIGLFVVPVFLSIVG